MFRLSEIFHCQEMQGNYSIKPRRDFHSFIDFMAVEVFVYSDLEVWLWNIFFQFNESSKIFKGTF